MKNKLQLKTAILCLTLLTVAHISDVVAGDGLGGVAGRLVQPGGVPKTEAVFLLFNTQTGPPPAPGQYFRQPDGSDFTDKEGFFNVQIPAGEYWYGVVERTQQDRGYFRGDLAEWLYLSHSEEGFFSLKVEEGKVLNIGEVTLEAKMAPRSMKIKAVTLNGRVYDQTKAPLPNFIVDVFSQDYEELNSLFSSPKTTEDGRYSLAVAEGNYLVRLRHIPGPNRNGFRNESAGKYKLPTPVKVSIDGAMGGFDLDLTVQDKSKK